MATSWTDPRTWTTGETPTAAQFNVHLRDNPNFLYRPPSTMLRHRAAWVVPNGTNVNPTFDNANDVLWDTHDQHSTGAAPAFIRFNRKGVYLCAGGTLLNPAFGRRRLRLAGVGGQTTRPDVSNGLHWSATLSITNEINATDTLALGILQEAGFNLGAPGWFTFLFAHWISDAE